jgi:hypothetical protein
MDYRREPHYSMPSLTSEQLILSTNLRATVILDGDLDNRNILRKS